MLRIVLTALLFLVLPDLYIHLCHLRQRPRPWCLLYWLPTVLLSAVLLLLSVHSGDNTLAHHTHAIGWLSVGILFFGLPKWVYLLCTLPARLVHLCFKRFPLRPFAWTGGLLALVCMAGIGYGSLIGPYHLQVRQVEFCSPRLPEAFDGYRVLQFSDLHSGSFSRHPEFVERLVREANNQRADLMVFSGDLVNQRSSELAPFVPVLSRLQAPDGVFSVLGNHDYGTYYRWPSPQAEEENLNRLQAMQEQMGWTLLNNDHRLIRRGNEAIALAGVENEGEPPFSQHGDLRQALQGTDSLFQILISHNPTHWKREVLPQSHVDLTLSGHTHAMQCVLFGRSLAALKYPQWHGLYRESHQALYVNIGIGYVGLPFRFNARPELTVITLRSKKN